MQRATATLGGEVEVSLQILFQGGHRDELGEDWKMTRFTVSHEFQEILPCRDGHVTKMPVTAGRDMATCLNAQN